MDKGRAAAATRKRAAKRGVNLRGLSDDQLDLVERFVSLLRRTREPERARADLKRLWREWSDRAPAFDQAEADRIAEEAVAFARRHP